jgi:hypothetical protein
MHATALSSRNKEAIHLASHRTVRVPPAQSAAVIDAVLGTYARKAGALAAATRAFRTAREPLAAIADARRDVIEAEATLDVLGWQPGARAGVVELTGPPGAVREVLYEALAAATERARAACREYERARIGRAALAAAVGDVVSLHELFDGLEAVDAPEAS